jgi:hypothetical protein
MAARRTGLARRAVAAMGLLVGAQLLMGDAIAPGCCGSHDNACAANEAIALTFEVSGDCGAPGTIRITGAAGSCKLAVEGSPDWLPSGYRDAGAPIGSGRWAIHRAADGYGCPISASATVPGDYVVTCDRLDAATCTSVLHPVP